MKTGANLEELLMAIWIKPPLRYLPFSPVSAVSVVCPEFTLVFLSSPGLLPCPSVRG